MMKGMQVRLAETREQVPIGRERWNELAARNATYTIFQTYEWFDTWWSTFGPRHQLFLLTVHEGEDVIGIAPLMLVKGAFGLRHLEFTGTPNADYQDLILGDRRNLALPAICAFLHSVRDRWDMIVLRNMRADGPTQQELATEFARLGLGVTDLERQPCPTLLIRGREVEIQNQLDRYSIRRSMKRLARRGRVDFRVLDSIEEIDRHLPSFFEQHISRWKSAWAPSPFKDALFRDWYHSLAHAAHAAGWLHFSVLECGGTPVAFHFGFRHSRALSWYKPSFHPEFARESPGISLIQHLVHDAGKLGLDELDFSGGQEPFKMRFSNTQRFVLNLRVFSQPLIYRGFVAAARLRRVARNAWWRLRGSQASGNLAG